MPPIKFDLLSGTLAEMQPVDAINMLNNIVTPANGATIASGTFKHSSLNAWRLRGWQEEKTKPPSPAQKHKECTVTLRGELHQGEAHRRKAAADELQRKA